MGEFGKHSFSRLPPDGSGKRLSALQVIHVVFTTGTIAFSAGQTVTGASSLLVGAIAKVNPTGSTSDGTIMVVVDDSSTALTFTVGENIQVNGITHAVVSSVTPYYATETINVGANNPFNGQFVDQSGNAFVRFGEGEQLLDAFGTSKNAVGRILKAYTHTYDTLPSEWHYDTIAGGAVTHLSSQSAVELSVGTAAGDVARMTTHEYHQYALGFANLVYFTLVTGDTGKDGKRVRWGYFDDEDGLFFEQDDTELFVVHRSSTISGSIVDTRVSQSQWNSDTLDGTGPSPANITGMNLDATKNNIYWLDYQWMGSGQVRFGVYDNMGARSVVHNIVNQNVHPTPYMRQGNLPLRVELENKGTTAGASTAKLICGAVLREGEIAAAREQRTVKYSREVGLRSVASTGSGTPIASYRSARFINSKPNRKISIPEFLSAHVTENSMILQLHKVDSVVGITGSSFSQIIQPDQTALEEDLAATSVSGSSALVTWVLEPGSHTITIPANFGIKGEHLNLRSDGGFFDAYTFVGRSLTAPSASIELFPTWIDVD